MVKNHVFYLSDFNFKFLNSKLMDRYNVYIIFSDIFVFNDASMDDR